MTYNLIERTFKEIYYRSRNTRKKEFSCENDWHDDSNHGSLPTIFFLFTKGLSQYHPKIIDFYFDISFRFPLNWKCFLLLCDRSHDPICIIVHPLCIQTIFFVGQNILLLNIMVSICSYRNLGFSICISLCMCF